LKSEGMMSFRLGLYQPGWTLKGQEVQVRVGLGKRHIWHNFQTDLEEFFSGFSKKVSVNFGSI